MYAPSSSSSPIGDLYVAAAVPAEAEEAGILLPVPASDPCGSAARPTFVRVPGGGVVIVVAAAVDEAVRLWRKGFDPDIVGEANCPGHRAMREVGGGGGKMFWYES